MQGDDVLAQAAAVIEATPEAHGQRVGRLIAEAIDKSCQEWIVTEASRCVKMIGALGIGDQTELVVECIARTMRRYADGIER